MLDYNAKQVVTFLFFVIPFYLVGQSLSHHNLPPWVYKSKYPSEQPIGCYYQVIEIYGSSLEDALTNAQKELVSNIINERGVHVSSSAVLVTDKEISQNDINQEMKYQSVSHKKISINGKTFARFKNIDKYYKIERERYHLWVLFLVATDDHQIPNLKPLVYRIDKGAWRSIIIPGWAQLYQKRPAIGIGMLAAEGLSLAGAFYFHSKYQENITLSNEAYKIDFKQEYRDRADNYSTISNICIGAAVGVYIYSIIDAFTSKKGIMRYSYQNNRLHFSVGNTPYLNGQQNVSFSLTYKI